MFFCCQQEQKGQYAFEVFQTPGQLSAISQEKEVVLKGFARQPKQRSRVMDRMGKYHRLQPGRLDSIMTYMKNHNQEFGDFAMKKVLKSDYQKLVEEYAHTDRKWTDSDFPPEQRSFGLGRQTEKVVWQRIDKIVKNPVFVGGGSIDPADILQGRIGDCYFLSAIAGLAEKDSRIKSIFGSLEINKNGIYMARVLHKGVFRELIMDDYFPVGKNDKAIMGCQPANGEQIWVMMLQKCWAKLYGSYQAIDGGLPNEVLHAYSAAPTVQFLTNGSDEDNDKLFELILEGDRKDWVICCGTRGSSDVESMGLVQGHAYTILSAFDRPRRLLKIRNPWGDKEWMGAASDRDDQFWKSLSKSDRMRLGHETNYKDGIFFMFWEEFLDYFQLVDICKVDERANYYYEELSYPRGRSVYTTLNTKGGEATIAITQENSRGKEVPDPRYATANILIAQKVTTPSGDDYKYIDSMSVRNRNDVNLEVILEAGNYVICSSLIGRPQKVEATLSCYCQTPIQMDLFSKIEEDDFMHRVFLNHAKNNKENHQKIFGNVDVWVCMDIVYDSGFAYTAVHIGPSAKTKLGLTFSEEEYEDNNFELLPPFKGEGTFKVVCESGQDSIVLCRIIPKDYMIEACLPIPGIKRLS